MFKRMTLLLWLASGSLALVAGTHASAQKPIQIDPATQPANRSERTMHATGTFQVDVKPAEPSAIAKAADTGRMTIDKTWSGDLTGTSKGEMLTGLTKDTGSMAYVAMERVSATLAGHTGTFLFQHGAYMQTGNADSAVAEIKVVKDSGTADLTGITGTLQITITGGVHHYDFTYTLPS